MLEYAEDHHTGMQEIKDDLCNIVEDIKLKRPEIRTIEPDGDTFAFFIGSRSFQYITISCEGPPYAAMKGFKSCFEEYLRTTKGNTLSWRIRPNIIIKENWVQIRCRLVIFDAPIEDSQCQSNGR